MKATVLHVVPPTFLDHIFGLAYFAQADGEAAFGRTEEKALRNLRKKIAWKIPRYHEHYEVEL